MPKAKRNTVMCATRLPEIMVKRVDAEANRLGTSRACFIEMALNEKLDGVPTPRFAPPSQALRDICAGKVPNPEEIEDEADRRNTYPLAVAAAILEQSVEIPICGKTWWEDGNGYECLMDKGHKNPKHGQAGMVRRLED